MSIKRIFIVISAIFAASAVFADNSSVTSKKYVDDLMSGYQGKLPGSGANTLMIYDDETGIGEKAIAATLGNSASATGVPTVGAVKTGLDGKQDTITGAPGYVMTGTGNPGEVGEKPIYGTNTNYFDALVTAETVNTGVINAVNSSLIRVGTDGQPNENGTLWEINTNLFALSVRPMLPDGYTQLQYIESTGTQYINTGVQNTSKLQLSMNLTAYNNDYTLIYGSQKTSSPVVRRSIVLQKDPKRMSLSSGSANQTANVYSAENTFATSVWHDVTGIWSATPSVKLDGVEYNSDDTSDNASTGLNDYLFCYNYGGTPNYKMRAKVSYAKIWDSNNSMVRNFVPAKRDSDSKIGMYDIVNDVFYPDAAGGNFTAGPSCISPNLFDKNNTTVLNLGASTGYSTYATNSERYGVAVKVEPNTTYTWSFNRGTQSAYINFVESVNYPTNGESYSSYVGIGNSASTYTFTTKSTTNYVYFYTTSTSFISTMQLEQGSTATAYRPYGENICD